MGTESRGRKDGDRIITAFARLRDITFIIRVAPFVYVLILLFTAFLYMFCDDIILDLIDRTFYVSPLIILLFFMLSYKLKLCNWYRTQCSLPLIPQVLSLSDTYIYEFGENVVYLSLVALSIIFLSTLVNTYFVFLRD